MLHLLKHDDGLNPWPLWFGSATLYHTWDPCTFTDTVPFPFLIDHIVFITARKRSCGKVMFLQVSLILFTGGVWSRGGACSGGVPAPGGVWSWGVPAPGGVWSRGVPALGGLLPGGACSRGGLVETPLPPDSYCCGQYASYWNAFLFWLSTNIGNV